MIPSIYIAHEPTSLDLNHQDKNNAIGLAIMVRVSCHIYLRRCCEDAHHGASQPLLLGNVPLTEGSFEKYEKADNRCEKVVQSTRVDKADIQTHKGPYYGTGSYSNEGIVDVAKRDGTVTEAIRSLPPSEIHDGRLFQKGR